MKNNLYNLGLKIIFVFILLFFIGTASFSHDLEYLLEYDDSITPFTVIPLFYDDVPKNVYSIIATLEFIDANEKGSFLNLKHSSYYPILNNINDESFSLFHFLWMLDREKITEISEMGQYERSEFLESLPKKVKIIIDYDKPLEPYNELLKINYDKNSNTRKVENVLSLEDEKNEGFAKAESKKAVIFVHGLYTSLYKNMVLNFNEKKSVGWRTEDLEQYWEKYYVFENTDYYEYHFDSLFFYSDYYGERFIQLIENSGILNAYEEIYLISYSMGTIVAQYSMNTKLDNGDGFLGDKIKNIFNVGSVLEGCYFINFTDYILTNVKKDYSLKSIRTSYDDERDNFFYDVLALINKSPNMLLKQKNADMLLENIVDFYKDFPLITCAMLVSFDDVPVIGGQIVPYDGVKSIRYTSKEFLQKLENKLEFGENTFVPNNKLEILNENNKYKDKIVFLTSYIPDSKELLNKIAFSLKYLIRIVDFEKNSVTVRDIPTAPVIQNLAQRSLSVIIKIFADIISEPVHALNDGYVSYWSQVMTDHQEGIPKENIYVFDNIDHGQIRNSDVVIKAIKSRIDTE